MVSLGEVNSAVNLLERATQLFHFFWCKRTSQESMCDDYYYQEYNKKIYVKRNGDGLIVSSCILKVIDPIKTDSLIRTLDISDAKDWAKFDSFDEMKERSMSDLFTKSGFWYKSDNDIVTDVDEFYEEELRNEEHNSRFISIRFLIDRAKLERGRTYHISYAFSIPGMYPIKDGRFDMASQKRDEYKDFRSYISTTHISHHLRFSAYFEEGIDFKEKPTGHATLSAAVRKTKKKTTRDHNCIYKDNIFYQKYHFEVQDPQDFSSIYLKWNVKNPHTEKAKT